MNRWRVRAQDPRAVPQHEDMCDGYQYQSVEPDERGGWAADYAVCQCRGGCREQDNLRHFNTREEAETWVGR